MSKTKQFVIPKSVSVGPVDYSVSVLKDQSGGCFDQHKQSICIEKDCSDQRKWDIFVHEVLESCMIESDARFELYGNGDNGQMLFSMDHDKFQIVSSMFARAIWPMVKPR